MEERLGGGRTDGVVYWRVVMFGDGGRFFNRFNFVRNKLLPFLALERESCGRFHNWHISRHRYYTGRPSALRIPSISALGYITSSHGRS